MSGCLGQWRSEGGLRGGQNRREVINCRPSAIEPMNAFCIGPEADSTLPPPLPTYYSRTENPVSASAPLPHFVSGLKRTDPPPPPPPPHPPLFVSWVSTPQFGKSCIRPCIAPPLLRGSHAQSMSVLSPSSLPPRKIVACYSERCGSKLHSPSYLDLLIRAIDSNRQLHDLIILYSGCDVT